MKKLMLLFIAVLIFSSCKRYYGCTCTIVTSITTVNQQSTTVTTSTTTTRDSFYDTKSGATSKCNALKQSGVGVTSTCTVAVN